VKKFFWNGQKALADDTLRIVGSLQGKAGDKIACSAWPGDIAMDGGSKNREGRDFLQLFRVLKNIISSDNKHSRAHGHRFSVTDAEFVRYVLSDFPYPRPANGGRKSSNIRRADILG